MKQSGVCAPRLQPPALTFSEVTVASGGSESVGWHSGCRARGSTPVAQGQAGVSSPPAKRAGACQGQERRNPTVWQSEGSYREGIRAEWAPRSQRLGTGAERPVHLGEQGQLQGGMGEEDKGGGQPHACPCRCPWHCVRGRVREVLCRTGPKFGLPIIIMRTTCF